MNARKSAVLRKVIPYAGTLAIFSVVFWVVPVSSVLKALSEVPVLKFLAVFFPFSLLYWMVDSYCLTWVVSRFNAPVRFRDVLPIRASTYLLSMINTNLGQGGVAWYVHRKTRVRFIEVLSSILLIGVMEIYQLLLFSTAGLIVYRPTMSRQVLIVHALRLVYIVAWGVLAVFIGIFAVARRNENLRGWIEHSKIGGVMATFLAARPRDYAAVLGIKSPGFLVSLIAQHFALSLYGIGIPFVKLVLFLPLVFLAAALPVAAAHLGTSQAAWVLFFAGSAPEARILAYSLAAHFIFMFCNGLIGLCFLPRASRELTAVQDTEPVRAVASVGQ